MIDRIKFFHSDYKIVFILKILRRKSGEKSTKLIYLFSYLFNCGKLGRWMQIIFFFDRSIVSGQLSHKSSEANVNPILNLYYSSKPILFIMCSGNELFYSMLYLLHFTEGPTLVMGLGMFRALSNVCFPIAVIKTILALMQGYYAAKTMAQIDVKLRAAEREKSK